VDATNTFRPVGVDLRGAPNWCGPRRPDAGRVPMLEVVTRITDPAVGAARPVQAVAWGIAGPAGRPRLTVDGAPSPAATGPSGTFLAVVGHDRPPDVRLHVTYAGAPALDVVRHVATRGVELRLPDPNGGLPWGIGAIPERGGGWCPSALGRIVGDRVGGVDFELGTFSEVPSRRVRTCGVDGLPNRRHPLLVSWGGGEVTGAIGDDPAPGRIARRTLPGTFQIAGIALPAVREVTIATPRDVRTLRPSRRAHAFAALYDGSFPTGRVVLTARLADGSVRRQVIENVPF
jgi:hypothetical protein